MALKKREARLSLWTFHMKATRNPGWWSLSGILTERDPIYHHRISVNDESEKLDFDYHPRSWPNPTEDGDLCHALNAQRPFGCARRRWSWRHRKEVWGLVCRRRGAQASFLSWLVLCRKLGKLSLEQRYRETASRTLKWVKFLNQWVWVVDYRFPPTIRGPSSSSASSFTPESLLRTRLVSPLWLVNALGHLEPGEP